MAKSNTTYRTDCEFQCSGEYLLFFITSPPLHALYVLSLKQERTGQAMLYFIGPSLSWSSNVALALKFPTPFIKKKRLRKKKLSKFPYCPLFR